MIYICRNPGDVAVSYYHFTKMIKPVAYDGEFSEFLKLFNSGKGTIWFTLGLLNAAHFVL